MSRGDSVKIRPHPGTSTEGLIDHIKPAIPKNPGIVVIHTGTNDLQNNCNIVKKAKKLVSAVKEVDKDNSIKIAFSSIINREDEDFKDKIHMSIINLKTTVTQQVWILMTIQILLDHV